MPTLTEVQETYQEMQKKLKDVVPDFELRYKGGTSL